MKSIFARHGIPQQVVLDNNPQCLSFTLKQFAEVYGFEHIASRPYNPQGNREAE